MKKFDKYGEIGESWYQYTVKLLESRGMTFEEIGKLVFILQKDYIPELNQNMINHAISSVLHNREVQNYIIMGLSQDILAEKNAFDQPYQEIMNNDEGPFGGDELLALGICNVFGTIGFTNFGYIDKLKPGILDWLNDRSTGFINVFGDDIIGAIAAASAAKLAHEHPGKKSVYSHKINEQIIKELDQNKRKPYSKRG